MDVNGVDPLGLMEHEISKGLKDAQDRLDRHWNKDGIGWGILNMIPDCAYLTYQSFREVSGLIPDTVDEVCKEIREDEQIGGSVLGYVAEGGVRTLGAWTYVQANLAEGSCYTVVGGPAAGGLSKVPVVGKGVPVVLEATAYLGTGIHTGYVINKALDGEFTVYDAIDTSMSWMACYELGLNRVKQRNLGVKSDLPDPQAQNRYSWPGHRNAALAEEELARIIHDLPDEVVIRWGDQIGTHGSDVISVNMKTGQVTLWDAKFRSNAVRIQPSPTFTPGTDRLDNALGEAISTIRNNTTLPANIRAQALRNLDQSIYQTRTVGMGNAKNSTLR